MSENTVKTILHFTFFTLHFELVIFCPVTTKVERESEILRVHLKKGTANLKVESDIMIDQIRAIDTRRLLNKVGDLPKELQKIVKDNIKIVLDIE